MNAVNHVKVWDIAVRVFHWSLVGAFTLSYFTGDEWESVHVWSGYTIATLLGFRLIWGFVGPRHARFSDFVYRPATVLAYLKDVLRGRPRRYLGHNPAGGMMIVLLLITLLATVLSGMAVWAVEEAAGPLAPWLAGAGEMWKEVFEEMHEIAGNLAVLLVVVHIGGVIVESVLHRESLVRAMITGKKRAE